MFVGGNAARLVELAKTEKDPELRQTGGALIEIYGAEKDPAVRKAVLQGLFQQSNATALVDLARKEQDPFMKRDIVQKLSVMGGNPAATAYMLELLNDK